MRRWRAVLGLVALASFGASAAGPRPRPQASACPMMRPEVGDKPSRECLACHQPSAHGHPTDIDYASAQSANPGLRPIEEVVRRGVFLPNGELRCNTCHDGRSPWKHHLALPPGSTPRPAVDPRDPATYDERESLQPPAAGAAVTARPLCLGCHALD